MSSLHCGVVTFCNRIAVQLLICSCVSPVWISPCALIRPASPTVLGSTPSYRSSQGIGPGSKCTHYHEDEISLSFHQWPRCSRATMMQAERGSLQVVTWRERGLFQVKTVSWDLRHKYSCTYFFISILSSLLTRPLKSFCPKVASGY